MQTSFFHRYDLAHLVFSFLTLKDADRLGKTCQLLRNEVAAYPWEDSTTPVCDIKEFFAAFPNAKALYASYYFEASRKNVMLCSSLKTKHAQCLISSGVSNRLVTLHIHCVNENKGTLTILGSERWPCLANLSVHCKFTTDETINNLVKGNFPALVHLDILFPEMTDIGFGILASGGLSHLKTLDMRNMSQRWVTDKAFEFLGSGGLPNLTELNMSDCHQRTITDKAFVNLAKGRGLLKLNTIVMKWCNQTTITRKTVEWLASRGQGNLPSLKIVDCSQNKGIYSILTCSTSKHADLVQFVDFRRKMCLVKGTQDAFWRNWVEQTKDKSLTLENQDNANVHSPGLTELARAILYKYTLSDGMFALVGADNIETYYNPYKL